MRFNLSPKQSEILDMAQTVWNGEKTMDDYADLDHNDFVKLDTIVSAAVTIARNNFKFVLLFDTKEPQGVNVFSNYDVLSTRVTGMLQAGLDSQSFTRQLAAQKYYERHSW